MLVLAPEFLPIRGGTGAYIVEVAKRTPKDINLHILTSDSCSNWTNGQSRNEHIPFDGQENVHLHMLKDPKLTFFGDAAFKIKVRARVERLIKCHEIDIIHSCSTMPDLLVSPGKISTPIVTTVHSTIEDHYRILKNLPLRFSQLGAHERSVLALGPFLLASEKYYYGGDRQYISVSAWGKENLISLKQVAPSRIRTIYNGVDGNIFNPSCADEARKVFPLIAGIDSPKILILSRLTAAKVTPYLSHAIRCISQKSDVHFIFAGSEYNRLLKDSRESCTFLGHVPHELTPYLYSLCNIFVLPSLYENFPISLLEAMASECAVVASNVGGIPEVVSNGVNGLLISPRDSETLVEKIGLLVENTDVSKTMGRRARQSVINNFSWDIAASRTFDYFEEIVSNR